MKKSFHTIIVFTKINTRRFFRDRLALFFTVIFPLIFLFVFGGLFGKSSNMSFKVAVINESSSKVSTEYVDNLKQQSKLFKINSDATTLDKAKEKMSRGELDGAIVLPADFGTVKDKPYPTGQLTIFYTQNNEQAAQTLSSVLQVQFKNLNTQVTKTDTPFTVVTTQTNDKALSRFDYVFAGLLGFSIIGLGIFGPVNVFPELKKQGILRRLHTTPLRVWQYFTSNVFSQTIVGLLSMAVMFTVAVLVFNLNLVGNIFALIFFLALSIITILGIGLAIGGWARNERQAAPLANIIVFPMLFLSGTFFPRFIMPEWLQKVSAFLPLTPAIDGIRLIATEGKSLVGVAPQIGLLCAWMVVIYAIAFRVFRWE